MTTLAVDSEAFKRQEAKAALTATLPPGFQTSGFQGDEPSDDFTVDEVPDQASIRNVSENPPTTTSVDEPSDPLDALLPSEFSLLSYKKQPLKRGVARQEWAHVVDVNQEISNFHELIPEMAREYPFELDNFQKEAVYHLEKGDSVFVAAHTSAGKTVVAEYAIALAAKHMTRAIYTSPIKALSNQKFRDFKNTFEDVGILTGDVQIKPEASCLIMTTEILRSMLYKGADLIRDVEFVIFDEVHYVNDLERGVVWEEVIIMLPDHVNIILLSATVPNTKEFASWVGRTKKKNIYVISTPKRPVPLEHYLWATNNLYKIIDASGKFIPQGYKDANAALHPNKESKPSLNRGKPNQRGRGAPARGGGNAVRGRGSLKTIERQNANVWVNMVQFLRKQRLLPTVIFVFSKRRCEENASTLANIDLNTSHEKSEIHVVIDRSVARLKEDDRKLPQILRSRELLARGIAVHHGGLLPIVKELVELLFARGLVKVLFATETFAMGVNMPAKAVVFSSIRKHDGRAFRDLMAGEYTQMAGRAGRRGLDKTGIVIIATAPDQFPETHTLNNLILGQPTRLRSQFRLTYNMILNLLRVQALRIEEMIKRSFSENASQLMLPEHEREVLASEKSLETIETGSCPICDEAMAQCHALVLEIQALTEALFTRALATSVGSKIFSAGRVVIVKPADATRVPAILLSSAVDGVFSIVQLQPADKHPQPHDWIAFIGPTQKFFTPPEDLDVSFTTCTLKEIEFVTSSLVTGSIIDLQKRYKDAVQNAESELQSVCQQMSTIEEVSWDRIRDVQFRELLDKRSNLIVILEPNACFSCPRFLEHFSKYHERHLIRENISKLKRLLSTQNLALLPDYEQRLAVLEELGFIDAESNVLLKGRVACEINSANELILTELVLDNILGDFEPEQIVSLLSAFVFEETTDVEPILPVALVQGQRKIRDIAARVNAIQERMQIYTIGEGSFESPHRFGLMEVVYEWARGMSFHRITDLTDVQEGTIVRVMTRLDETCREVKSAARLIGDMSLYAKMESAQACIKKDIIFAASLYF